MAFLTKAANRGSIATGYEIENSLKLEPDNAEFLKRNQADGNRKTWTYSMWVKRTELGMSDGMALFYAGVYHQATRMFFDAGAEMDQLTIDLASETTTQYRWITNRVFRDTSAWYHFVWRVDTTQSTATDRMRMYVNGVLLTADDFQQTATFPQNTDTTANKSNLGGQQQMAIGNYSWANNNGIYAGYAAQCALVDGESLAPTEFGEFDEDTGIWKPKDISGLNYGTGNNSFFLDFEIASDLGGNAKGNDVNFTLNNITSADQATDTPTNNFCTWNINYNYTNSNGNPTITEGATKTVEAAGGWTQAKATMGVTSGKWYWEYKMGGSISFMGVQDDTASQTAFSGQYSLFLYNGDNTVEINDTGSNRDDTTLSYTFSTSNIYAVALNMDDNEISYYQNGSIIGSAISLDGLANRLLLPYIGTNSSTNETNFGGYTTISISSAATDANGYGTFEYAPPSGYYALCTKNLAEYG